jgi:hypothetical protein
MGTQTLRYLPTINYTQNALTYLSIKTFTHPQGTFMYSPYLKPTVPINLILIGLTAGIITALFSLKAQAHVRWLVETPTLEAVNFEWNIIYYLILIGGASYCLFCIGFTSIEQRWTKQFPRTFSLWPYKLQWRLISILLGIALLINCIQGVFLAPNLPGVSLNSPVNIFQALVAASLVTGLTPTLGGASLLGFIMFSCWILPLRQLIDYLPEFIGVGLALILYRQQPIALALLRISLGLQLIILAIHNKLLNPELGLEFLRLHPWNFMQMLGFKQFGDLEFVFAGGIAELCFGLAIMLGWSTRFATLSITFFFTATAVTLGLHELVGHIPIMAIAITLISLGGGKLVDSSRLAPAPKLLVGQHNPP